MDVVLDDSCDAPVFVAYFPKYRYGQADLELDVPYRGRRDNTLNNMIWKYEFIRLYLCFNDALDALKFASAACLCFLSS